jgi:hypothetical protein
MKGRIGIILAVFVAVLSIASIAAATSTTCTSALKETLTTGTIVSGSANWLCYEDGVTEVLREALDGGVSHLRVMWRFDNVPAGVQSITFYGTRPANTDGDNFQFYYNQTGGAIGLTITGALINKTFAPAGGVTAPLNLTTTQPSTIYILLGDTTGGAGLDTVNLDRVVVVTQ